jgi:PAS domain S-box-containing protein
MRARRPSRAARTLDWQRWNFTTPRCVPGSADRPLTTVAKGDRMLDAVHSRGAGSAPVISLALQRALLSGDVLVERLPIGIYTCDRDGLLVQYNRRAAELWGRCPVPGDMQFRFCGAYKAYRPNGEPLPFAQAPMREVLATGEPVRDREVIFERPDGTRVAILANMDPLFDAFGRIVGGVGCVQDMTGIKRMQERQAESEPPFRAALEALPAAIYTTDAEGRITFYNQAAVEMSGRQPQLGSDQWCVTWRLYHPDGTPMPHDECPMAVALKEGRSIRGAEAVAERPDGTRVPFIPYPTPLRDASGALVGAVNMLVDISERKRAQESVQRLISIVESSDDAIVSKDLNGVIASWNKGAERLFGYAAEEVIGKPITILIPWDRQDEEPGILDRIRRGERIDHYETVRRRKDGSLVEISLTVSPIKDAQGRVIGVSKIARDITERRRAEERQKALLDELNHRVKNTLATVQSLAAQTIRGSGVPNDVRAAFEARLMALSRTHDQLSREQWQSADFGSIIHDIFAPYRSDSADRVHLDGPTVKVAPQSALTLGMVLHELATNAAKYGALSASGGALTVSWKVVANGAGPTLALKWHESGGPPVRTPQRRGFGSRLVERGITHELKGSAHIAFEPDGVRCEIQVPLSAPQSA